MNKSFILTKETSNIGDLMTVEDFVGSVNAGAFIDCDGYGNFSDGTFIAIGDVIPSDIKRNRIQIPDWATHVRWYNR